MAFLGAITVGINADTSKFRKGVNRTRRDLKGFDRHIIATRRAVIGFGAAALGVAAAGGGLSALARGFSSTAQELDKLAKTSARIGILSEHLGGLQHAAELTGAGADKLAAGMNVLAKRLGEVAIKGTGAAKGALQALRLNAEDLIKLNPDVQLKLIADRMAQLSTQSERNAVAANLFSRANQDLVNTLALGSKGLASMQREAELLGLTVGSVDLDNIQNFNDEVTRLKAITKGFKQEITIDIAPMASKAIADLTALYKIGRRAMNVQQAEKDLQVRERGTVTERRLRLGPTGFFTDMHTRQATTKERQEAGIKTAEQIRAEQRTKTDEFLLRHGPTASNAQVIGAAKGLAKGFAEWFPRELSKSKHLLRLGANRAQIRSQLAIAGYETNEQRNQRLLSMKDRFGIDRILAGAQAGRQLNNPLLQGNTLEGYRALRANVRPTAQGQTQLEIARKHLAEAQKTNKTLADVWQAVIDSGEVDEVGIP